MPRANIQRSSRFEDPQWDEVFVSMTDSALTGGSMISVRRVLLRWFVFLCTAAVAVHCQANNSRINSDKVLEIDGKKIFVIGFTMPPPAEAKAPNGKGAIEELADAGATFLRAGPAGKDWGPAKFEEERKYEDAAARYGMHCWLNLHDCSSIKPGDTNREQLLRKI